MQSQSSLVVISVVITTILKHPAVVGEARNVEPDEEGLNLGKACEYDYPPVRVASGVDKN